MRLILGSFIYFVSIFVNALVIEPMVLEMTTEQQAAIVISNPTNKAIAVDAQALEIDFSNNNTLREVNNELLIFPPAFMLKAGAKQHVRLIWNTNKTMPKTRSFYIRFETPVLQRLKDENGSSVDVQIDYNALVHLSQKEHKPKLSITQQYIKQNHLILELFNGGQKYDSLANYNISNKNLSLSNEVLIERLGNVFFPPQRGSKLAIPMSLLPKNFDQKEKISLKKSNS